MQVCFVSDASLPKMMIKWQHVWKLHLCTSLHQRTMLALAQRIRSRVCTTAAHCLASSAAIARPFASRRAKILRHARCSTMDARAGLDADSSREQRNASAAMVTSRSKILRPADIRDAIYYISVSFIMQSTYNALYPTKLWATSKRFQSGLQRRPISASADSAIIIEISFVFIHNAFVDPAIGKTRRQILQMQAFCLGQNRGPAHEKLPFFIFILASATTRPSFALQTINLAPQIMPVH